MECLDGVTYHKADHGLLDSSAGSGQYQAEESISGSIYKLLIKNVSKNQPLTAEEAQVAAHLQKM